MRVARPCCATTILSRMVNACYHRVFVTRLCVCGDFFACTSPKSTTTTTTGIDGERGTALCRLPRDTDAAGAAAPLRARTHGGSTRGEKERRSEREREREPRTQPPHMKLHTHARDVKTAGPPLLHRALLLAPPPCSLVRSLSLSFSLSPLSPFLPSLPTPLVISRWITSRTKDT